jgi:hypothetical protein
MPAYPLTVTRYEVINGVDHVIVGCKCGKIWKRRTARPAKLIPISEPKPFMCPKCGVQVSRNTGWF